jgi:hypothetical protein
VGWCTRLLVSNSRERPTRIKNSPCYITGEVGALRPLGGGIVFTLVSTSSSFSTGDLRKRLSTLRRVSCESFVQVRATSKMQASDTTGASAFVPEETVVRRQPFVQLCVYCQKVFDDWAVVVHTLQKESKSGSLPSYLLRWRFIDRAASPSS